MFFARQVKGAIIAVLKDLKWRLVRHNSSSLRVSQIHVSEAYRHLNNDLTKTLITWSPTTESP